MCNTYDERNSKGFKSNDGDNEDEDDDDVSNDDDDYGMR